MGIGGTDRTCISVLNHCACAHTRTHAHTHAHGSAYKRGKGGSKEK